MKAPKKAKQSNPNLQKWTLLLGFFSFSSGMEMRWPAIEGKQRLSIQQDTIKGRGYKKERSHDTH